MGKIRSKAPNNKIDGKSNASQGCCSDQYPWFSFRSMTKNAKYNLTDLPAGTVREQVLWGLYTRLNELSHQPWLYWTQQPKRTGLETLSYHQLNFSADPDAGLTKDTTIYVFRFDTHQGAGQGRIIGYKKAPCAVLYIIGFDLDFSAYDHG